MGISEGWTFVRTLRMHIYQQLNTHARAGQSSPPVPVPEVYTADSTDPEIVAFQQHQKTAAKPSPVEVARTMVSLSK